MKKIFYILTVGTFIILQACKDYLDVVPDNVATIDNAFTDRTNAEKFLFTCYRYLPGFADPRYNPGFVGSDEIWLHQKGNYLNDKFGSSLTWDIARGEQNINDPLLNFWDGRQNGSPLWIGIRDCNIFLENIDKPRDLDEYEKKRWIAEVKTLKAYYHFYLLRLYGAIPIVDENLETSNSPEEVRVYRDKFDDVVAYISDLVDEAMEDLPLKVLNDAEELGHITKPIAAAIKAKNLVLAASPLFNGNADYAGIVDNKGNSLFPSSYSPEKWVKARDAVKAAIDIAHEAGHGLYKFQSSLGAISDSTILKLSLRNAVAEKWNEEIIWGNTSSTWQIQRNCHPRLVSNHALNTHTHNLLAPTYRMLEAFYTENGVPIDEDKTWDYENRLDLKAGDAEHKHYIKEGYETVKLHFDREARFYASLGFDGGIWYGAGRENDNDTWHLEMKEKQIAGHRGPGSYSITGSLVKKLVNYKTVPGTGSNFTIEPYSFPIIRLADLYLMYAEALNEVANAPNAEVYEYIDKVRERAGLNGVVDSYLNFSINPQKPTTKDGMREIIQHERTVELAFEGHRFWDLRRWKLAVKNMNAPVKGWNVFEESAERFYKPVILFDQTFSVRDYLWPIREYSLLVNTNLVQNYGW
ncbi:MAG: RagB/SusD family nutrient uptake outer membrane protein [Cytophagales bacterium]|nr:RagB/SusD family nutrient uptake outer membrane protein [Cytophagales bacterium]